MNFTNPFGSITSISAVIAGVLALMASALGCTAGADALAGTCTASWLTGFSPQFALYAGMAFGVLTLIGKLTRPGGTLGSLFGSTAVVVAPDKAGPGTVTKAQVASH